MLPISIGAILSLVTGLGPTLSNVGKQISDYKIAKGNTESQREKNKIDQQIDEAHDRRDVIVAEAGNRVAVIMKGVARAALILPAVAILNKLVTWDLVIGSLVGCSKQYVALHPDRCISFATDPMRFTIEPTIGWIIAAACGFYLMYDIASVSRRSK